MASKSSSAITAFSGANDSSSYDVFLSFRGEDTRDSFTDHLYEALRRGGIDVFRLNEEIRRGEEVMPEIERAIKESRASIVVLSQNYATSTWCLDELLLILQQRREHNHFVLPVFYHVDPSDVRKQNNTFAIEVKPYSRWTDHNVNLWKKALKQVADLAGMVLSGSETMLLKDIVDTIYNKLGCKEVHLPANLTGLATRYEEIESWLNLPNVQFLVISGMPGSGKTTLAKYIYDSNWRFFENTSFVEDIGHRWKEANSSHEREVLVVSPEQLFQYISYGTKNKFGVFEVPCKIEEVLQTKKTLIVLDDIHSQNQLSIILGAGKINAQSKIIITTTWENVDGWSVFKSWRRQDYKMKLLNDDESRELLSRHAFGFKVPVEGFEKVAAQAVRYCEGNPLALEVLASSLSNEKNIVYWKSHLKLLEKDFDSRIEGVLIRSYESLPYALVKELFLHIACFFIGKDKDYVQKILEHDYSALSGIKTLSNRCLLSVSPTNKLVMHRLIQEMGKNIVRKESLKFPAKRSRVWLTDDARKILIKEEGSETMEGLALNSKMPAEVDSIVEPKTYTTNALKKMDNLKLLQLDFVQLSGSYENFSQDLRWLCWHGFPLEELPSELSMGKLVALDMSHSELVVFEPPEVLQSLLILNLTDSRNLRQIHNLSRIPHLEILVLADCSVLSHVCETIGDLTRLATLNMTGCERLYYLTFSFPRSLQRLFLMSFPSRDIDHLRFSDQLSLEYLNLGNSDYLLEFRPSYDQLKKLRVLDLSSCKYLKKLDSLLSTLAELYVYFCTSLEKISFQSHLFTLQEFGYEGCSKLSEVEGFFKLARIEELKEHDLGHMKWLKKYKILEVCLAGDDELTKGRSPCLEMLYEFDIMSTSLPFLYDPNMTPDFASYSSASLSFYVPPCPKNKKRKGIDVTFRYTITGDDVDMVWFCKISTTNGVDLMYNPKVFGKPDSGNSIIWLSYWPIGNKLRTRDEVNVSIAVVSGLKVHACGVSLVYADDAEGTSEINTEILGGHLSNFQLSTGAYYLCRRDFYELMEVGRLTPDWFRILVGDTIDYREVRGWRKTGRHTLLPTVIIADAPPTIGASPQEPEDVKKNLRHHLKVYR